jgi:Mg-chelatase subunit ChlD
LEKIKRNEDASIFFTWPKPFDLGSKVCEKSADIVLLLDRSGSMASLALEPPQPLTDAKEAAASFVDRLTVKDQVSVISFATKPKEPIELGLTNDFGLAKKMIDLIKIEKDGTQFTNLFDSLRLAWQELVSVRANENSSKIAILLTDGVANNPRDPKGRSEVDDIKYAENLALGESANMKASGLKIYTIGLGEKINELFLKKIASEETDYFYAPSATNLEKIYENISSSICKEVPARIDVTYRIFGDSL